MPVKNMHVCVLIDEGYDEFDPGNYLKDYTWERVVIDSPVLESLRAIYKSKEFDCYLNLCEGFEEPYYSGLDVVRALETLQVPFTGADSRCFSPTREKMESAAESNGVRFVRGVNVSNVREAEALTAGLKYPLMVKHPNSYGSTGMTRNSKVENTEKMKQQVRRISKNYGSARVEEFIDGREFTTFVVDNPDDLSEPFVYPSAELTMPSGESFLHSRVKWQEYVYLKKVKDDELNLRLEDLARRMFVGLHQTGYARCDFRMSGDGDVVMIEINPNNGILYKPEDLGPADVMMEYDPDGHDGFLDRLFRSALIRHRERVFVAD